VTCSLTSDSEPSRATFEVKVANSAAKGLARLERRFQEQIAPRLESLAQDPRPHDSIKLKGSPYYRFDVGNYRVVYEVDYDARRVSILTIGDRKNVYRRY